MNPGSSLFEFRHGDHICVFHRSDDSLMEVLSPYIAEGLLRGERCFCVQRPEIASRLEHDLRFLGIDFDKAVSTGALQFQSIEQAYLPGGRFEPAAMMDMLLCSIEESVRKGFSGFRSAGDLSWGAHGRDECRQIVGYEALVEKCFPGKPATGLCQYPIASFPDDVLQEILKVHRQQIVEPVVPSHYASISIRTEHRVAEIVADKFVTKPKYYFVVEDQRHREILGWGTTPDFEIANLRARHVSRRRASRHLPN